MSMHAREMRAHRGKAEKVMSEFKHGTLMSGSGKKVTSRKQAIAIALSEQRKSARKKRQRRK